MKIKVQRKINAPSSVLWDYIGDYANIHKFHPLLSGSHFNEGTATCEVGSTRQCDMKSGDFLKEKITDWKEGSHYSVEIYETSMPVKNAKATVGVKPLGKEVSEAYMHVEMDAKYAILRPLIYLMFRYYVSPAILKGLDKLYHKEHKVLVA